MKKQIKKILIANRGEIAVRVIRACRELDIISIAVFSDSDRKSPHVLMADEAYHIGPSPSLESYLKQERIIDVALRANADAIHPGYGFLAENTSFARKVKTTGLIFIGPEPDSIEAMGDKTKARRLMQDAGIPIVPGTTDPIKKIKEVQEIAEEIEYPILLKAAGGGGGKGMRIVHSIKELESAFKGAQNEARSAFGDDRIYIEKYLKDPRHIEFQILSDKYGNTIHIGERECSIQRRHQKIIEESPSVIVDTNLRKKMGETAVRAAKACRYINAGTIEFLVDANRSFYFLEMNTRIQVEHPVTEMVTGIDLVKQQIRIAEGEKLPFKQEDVTFRGHAIECRIYAEDPLNNFLPSIGTIRRIQAAQGPGIREDRGVQQGNEISVYYDPMISKLVAWGNTREEAIKRMDRALNEYLIQGVLTNIPACLAIIRHPTFLDGSYTTHFIQEHYSTELIREGQEQEYLASGIAAIVMNEEEKRRPKITTLKTNTHHSRWKDQIRSRE